MAASPDKKPGLFKSLFRTFLAGLLAALPIVLTIAASVWLAEFIHRFLGPASGFGKILGKIGLRFVTSEASAYFRGDCCFGLSVSARRARRSRHEESLAIVTR